MEDLNVFEYKRWVGTEQLIHLEHQIAPFHTNLGRTFEGILLTFDMI